MSAPGMTSPIRPETFQKLQLNAGIFLKNFPITGSGSPETAAALKTAIATAITGGSLILGATRGGGSFTVTREIREPEVDGRRYPFKGGKFIDSADARLNTTLIEVTPENIATILGSTVTTDGSKKIIRLNTVIADSSYLTSLVWIGDLADGSLVAISLFNALNTADFSLTFTDKGEGTLPVEFHAHQENVSDYDVAPFEIVYF